MTHIQFQNFFAEQIRGRWEKWVPSQATLDDWWDELQHYTEDVALAAIKTHKKSSKAIASEPKINEVMHILYKRKREGSASQPCLSSILHCYIKCIVAPEDHPEWTDMLWPVAVTSKHTVSVEAANLHLGKSVDEVVRSNGGRWGSVVSYEMLMPDDGLRGSEAAKKAREIVLAGPDMRGRRHLLGKKLLAGEFSLIKEADIPF
uniref:Uncharacterized protein n=1 Tax=viral metagenome TaxID=1070528 RepID=A0A6M3LIV6_9ZZZZ